MKASSLTIKTATAILGEARGGTQDMGEPRLVLDAADGERVYATFGRGQYVDTLDHYRAFARDVALSLDRAAMARLAVKLLEVLPADVRSDVIAEVVGRVTVRPETIGDSLAFIDAASRRGMDAQS